MILLHLHVQVKEEVERVVNSQHDCPHCQMEGGCKSMEFVLFQSVCLSQESLSPKSVALFHQGEVRCDPLKVQDALFAFWAGLENWTCDQLKACLETLEDKYSFLLPHHDYHAYVQPAHLMDVAKTTKASSRGVDGWTHKEHSPSPCASMVRPDDGVSMVT